MRGKIVFQKTSFVQRLNIAEGGNRFGQVPISKLIYGPVLVWFFILKNIEGSYFRRELERLVNSGIIQWLYTGWISDKIYSLFCFIIQCKCKHAPQPVKAVRIPLGKCSKNNFCITFSMELPSHLLQLIF